MGGFIQDDDQRALSEVPGASSLGVVGRLFAVNSDTVAQTEIVMTVPRMWFGSQGSHPPQTPISIAEARTISRLKIHMAT